MEKFELSVLKFAQLAYNVGQLLAVFTQPRFNESNS